MLWLATLAAVASIEADVDGDGKKDVVSVTTQLEVAFGGKKKQVEWAAFASSGTVTDATITVGGKGKTPFVAVMATIGGAHEGLVVQWQKGALVEVWRGDVGPVGRDGDYAIAIEASPRGLLRWQTRADVVRCDGAGGRLFPEAWSGGAWKAMKNDAPSLAADAPVLKATKTAPEGAASASVVYRAAAVSSEAGVSDAGALTAPRALDDGDAKTVWSMADKRDGRGEFVTFRARRKGAKLAALRIVPGDARSAKQWKASNRPQRFAVVTKDRAFWVDLGDENAEQWVVLDEPIDADCVSVVWSTFHAGTSKTTVVTDLAALGDGDLAPGGGDTALVDTVIAGGLDGDSAAKQLARRGARAARAIEAKLTEGVDSKARQRLWLVLAQIADPGSAAELGRALSADGSRDEDIAAFADALARLGEPGQDQLAVVVADGGATEAARVAAADGLGEARRDALVAALGAGSPRSLRRSIATKLASAGVAWLIAQAEQAEADGAAEREADVWRGVGLAARGGADRDAALQALAARGGEVTDYERRYRIVFALAALGEAAAVEALAAILAKLDDGAEAAALRQVAAAGLAEAGEPATALLADLADDGDPGVRLAALKALAGRSDLAADAWSGSNDEAVDRVLIDALAGDRWPEVRTTAAAALALACPRAGATRALEDAADGDTDDDVRVAALSALVTCDAPGIATRLLALAKSGKASLALRQRAVDFLGVHGDPDNATVLAELLAKWRSAAFSEQSALVLAQAAAPALGHLGAAAHAAGKTEIANTALDALLDAAADPAFPEIQAAGAAGLGALGAACNADAVTTLKELARSEQPAVTIAAKRALATCQ